MVYYNIMVAIMVVSALAATPTVHCNLRSTVPILQYRTAASNLYMYVWA